MAAGGAAGGEEKKNAFASFGGFSATSTPVAGGGSDAFGFLKKGKHVQNQSFQHFGYDRLYG